MVPFQIALFGPGVASEAMPAERHGNRPGCDANVDAGSPNGPHSAAALLLTNSQRCDFPVRLPVPRGNPVARARVSRGRFRCSGTGGQEE